MPTDIPSRAPIDEGAVYCLDDFLHRVGLTRHGLRTARRAGLQVYYAHGRCYVRGGDWVAYIRQHGRSSQEFENLD